MTPRDTQFQGFASRLLDELLQASVVTIETPFQDDWREEWQNTIAQRAYDLVAHTLDNVRFTFVKDVPDLTVWPESLEDM